MIMSISFIGLAVMIEAWPIYNLATHALRRGKLATPEVWSIAPSLLIVLALTVGTVWAALRGGAKSLERINE